MRWASLRPRVADSSVVTAPRSSSTRRISMRRSTGSYPIEVTCHDRSGAQVTLGRATVRVLSVGHSPTVDVTPFTVRAGHVFGGASYSANIRCPVSSLFTLDGRALEVRTRAGVLLTGRWLGLGDPGWSAVRGSPAGGGGELNCPLSPECSCRWLAASAVAVGCARGLDPQQRVDAVVAGGRQRGASECPAGGIAPCGCT
jgi:hypothetical protein